MAEDLARPTPPELKDRYLRQEGLLPAAKLGSCPVTVIGVGAIGRQVAIQLATIGVTSLTLIDPDVVEAVNLGAQGFLQDDLGRPKVHATADLLHQINHMAEVHSHRRRFQKSAHVPERVFCCVDSIDTRRHIFNALKGTAAFFVDGRMSAETLRILCVHDSAGMAHYPTTLFDGSEAHRGACTVKAIFYAATIAAGMMVSCFARWLRGISPPVDMSLNLLADEMVVSDTTH